MNDAEPLDADAFKIVHARIMDIASEAVDWREDARRFIASCKRADSTVWLFNPTLALVGADANVAQMKVAEKLIELSDAYDAFVAASAKGKREYAARTRA